MLLIADGQQSRKIPEGHKAVINKSADISAKVCQDRQKEYVCRIQGQNAAAYGLEEKMKNKRHVLIMELINSMDIETQEDLASRA